jgi:hypothetical protein
MFTFGSGSSFSFGYSYSSRRYRHESRPKVLKAGQVTPRLPNELFERVVEHLGASNAKGGLAKLLQTSRAAYDAVAPTLYKEVVITRQNAKSFYLGLLPGPPRLKQAKRDQGITWDEFINTDRSVLAEETRNRDRLRKGGEKRKLFAVWPDVDIVNSLFVLASLDPLFNIGMNADSQQDSIM